MPPPLHPAPDLFVLESGRWVHRCAATQPSLFLPESSASVACASHLNGSSARLFSLLSSDYFSVLVHKRKLRKARLCCCIAETRHSWLLVWCGGGKKRWPKPPAKWDLGDVTQAPPTKESMVIKRRGCCPPSTSEDRCSQGQLFKVVQHVMVQEWRHRLTLESKVVFLRVPSD